MGKTGVTQIKYCSGLPGTSGGLSKIEFSLVPSLRHYIWTKHLKELELHKRSIHFIHPLPGVKKCQSTENSSCLSFKAVNLPVPVMT